MILSVLNLSAVTCPLAAALGDIPLSDCPENFGQIQKVIFIRKYASPGVLNEFVIATEDPKVLATWTGRKAAVDSTKAVVSPFIEDPNTTPGAKKTFGGGDQTLNGIPLVTGSEPTTNTARLNRYRQDVIAAMKTFSPDDVTMILINQSGQLGGWVDNIETPTKMRGLPVQGLFFSDKGFGNVDGVDHNLMEWDFAPNWSDCFGIITPTDFSGVDL